MRVGGFIGPAAAFCGKWSSTFNCSKYRDKALFKGTGFRAGLKADYFLMNKKAVEIWRRRCGRFADVLSEKRSGHFS